MHKFKTKFLSIILSLTIIVSTISIPVNVNAETTQATSNNSTGSTLTLLKDKTFNGTSDYVNYGYLDLDYSQGFDIHFTARWDAFNNLSKIIDFGNGTSSDDIFVSNFGTSNGLSVYVYKGSACYYLTLYNMITIGETNTWDITFDSNGFCKVYKDGILRGSKQLALPNNLTRTNCYVGKSNYIGNGFFKGEITNLYIHTNNVSEQADGIKYVDSDLTGSKLTLLQDKTFNGTSDYVDYGPLDYDYSKGFTIHFTARWDAFNNYSRIIDSGNGGAFSDNIIISNEGTSSSFRVQVYKGSTYCFLTLENMITIGETNTWDITFDSSGYCKVYKDGILRGFKQLVLPNNLTRINCFIGKAEWSGDLFKGEISNLYIHEGLGNVVEEDNYPVNTPDDVYCADPVDTGRGAHKIQMDALKVKGAQNLSFNLSYDSSQLSVGTMG